VDNISTWQWQKGRLLCNRDVGECLTALRRASTLIPALLIFTVILRLVIATTLDLGPAAFEHVTEPIQAHTVFLLIILHEKPGGPNQQRNWTKRSLDVIISSLLLMMVLPICLLIACLVHLDGGPVFYASPRLGFGGKQFCALKFRTMAPDADVALQKLLERDPAARREWETSFKLRDDPRVTPVGRFLRRLSLDELPQLINVLHGEMSLVGPRPLLPTERDAYGDAFNLYCKCLPGITGPWQVSGRNDLDYKRRVELNLWYADNSSVWVDLAILVRTLYVVFRGKGAM
jgi:Undecaprenyl-phosphate galactose phosphotransferase WbaP